MPQAPHSYMPNCTMTINRILYSVTTRICYTTWCALSILHDLGLWLVVAKTAKSSMLLTTDVKISVLCDGYCINTA